ncbi:uncharacterized protein N7518_007691 [Penicillium psychrosexuale]|uniref:uncharacterized protein n=1 Tax=Penicillium psychrosexuale TaxID=1002107 RepID=UPI002544EE78|nr:uncharacterized protein N7518_007691 [Penicillium psychrosexuale]KAJ5790680.1 hypothetical protein N7518_007691 [Penicillium psychrosexuale]
MEEAFQSLTAGKVQELLVFCGIGDCNYEPIKQHILGISDFDLPPLLTPRASPDLEAKRGSYRFLPTSEKRS